MPLRSNSKGNWETGNNKNKVTKMDMNKFNLQKFIVSVVIVSVALIIGIYITDSIGETVKAENTAGSVTNETGAYVNTTGYTLALSTSKEDFASPTITAVWANVSGTPYLVPPANYTLTGNVLTNATVVPDATGYNDAVVSYTYTYTASTDASDAADDVVDALATGTSWISILVVVGFAVIVLTMLTSGLGSSLRDERQTPYY